MTKTVESGRALDEAGFIEAVPFCCGQRHNLTKDAMFNDRAQAKAQAGETVFDLSKVPILKLAPSHPITQGRVRPQTAALRSRLAIGLIPRRAT